MSGSATQAVEALRPIELTELNARAALQTRVDSKYVVPVAVLAEVTRRLADELDVLVIEGQHDQLYDTVYFDTADLATYRAHLQRRRRAFKLRTRTYTISGACSFEVKMLDGRRTTVKKRTDHDGEAVRLGTSDAAFYRRTLQDHYGLEVDADFGVSLRNRYRRITLAAREGEERTTVDHDLHFVDGNGTSLASLDAGHVLVETKTPRGNGRVDRLLWDLGARPTRMSKYCVGVGLTATPVPSNRYARAMRTWFGWSGDRGPVGRVPPAPAPDVTLRRAPRPPRPPRPPRAPRGIRPLRKAEVAAED